MSGPSVSPQNPGEEARTYTGWRQRFLQTVLQTASVVGLVTVLIYILSAVSLPAKVFAALLLGVLLAVTRLVALPYALRAGFFVLILYSAGLGILRWSGIAEASLFFLGFVVMAGLLVPLRNGIYYALGIALLSLLLFGVQGVTLLEWLRPVGILLAISLIVAVGLRSSLNEFSDMQRSAQEVLETLWRERSTLEERIEERTSGLIQKTEQLRATSYIARQTAEVQDLPSLLETVARLVSDQFGFYHTGIFLINETGDRAILQAASSEGGRRMVEMGHWLSVGTQGIVGYVAAQKKPRIALDVGADAVFFNNPYLPMTRSEVALPLLIQNRVLGVLDIQSDSPQAFNSEDIDILQTLADQLAVAIEHARLLDETQAAMAQLQALTRIRTREAWSQKLAGEERVFTYTPLGLRAEKPPQGQAGAIRIPIRLRGQEIGTISIARKGEANWSQLDRELVAEVAGQVGLAIDNIRLLEDATRRAIQEQTVGRLATRFSQSLDLDTLLQTAARELGQLPDVSEVSVYIGQDVETAAKPRSASKRKMS